MKECLRIVQLIILLTRVLCSFLMFWVPSQHLSVTEDSAVDCSGAHCCMGARQPSLGRRCHLYTAWGADPSNPSGRWLSLSPCDGGMCFFQYSASLWVSSGSFSLSMLTRIRQAARLATGAQFLTGCALRICTPKTLDKLEQMWNWLAPGNQISFNCFISFGASWFLWITILFSL